MRNWSLNRAQSVWHKMALCNYNTHIVKWRIFSQQMIDEIGAVESGIRCSSVCVPFVFSLLLWNSHIKMYFYAEANRTEWSAKMRRQRETAFYDMPMIDKNSFMHISSGLNAKPKSNPRTFQLNITNKVKQVNFVFGRCDSIWLKFN